MTLGPSALFERFAAASDMVRLSARSVSSIDHTFWVVLPFGAFGPSLADLVTSVIPVLRGNSNFRGQWQCRFITAAQERSVILQHKTAKDHNFEGPRKGISRSRPDLGGAAIRAPRPAS